MLLAVDIGNSSAKLGVFDRETLLAKHSIPIGPLPFPAEFPNISEPIDSIIVSSVVPELNGPFAEAAMARFGVEPVFVDHSFDFGLQIDYRPPEAVGIDRLVAAAAAAWKYGKPCIVCDFGTATTIDAVSANGEYLGGTITPGISTLARSLFQNTSKLPEIEIRKPSSVIGKSTAGSIESGVFYGYIGLVGGILSRMKLELEHEAQVIATGGYVRLIAENTRIIEVVDENLMFEGLYRIYLTINH